MCVCCGVCVCVCVCVCCVCERAGVCACCVGCVCLSVCLSACPLAQVDVDPGAATTRINSWAESGFHPSGESEGDIN